MLTANELRVQRQAYWWSGYCWAERQIEANGETDNYELWKASTQATVDCSEFLSVAYAFQSEFIRGAKHKLAERD